MDDPGFESRQGQQVFLLSEWSRPDVGPTQPLAYRVRGFFHGHDVDHLSASNAEVKKRGAIMRLLPFTLMAWTETALTN